ncbi:asparagine synthase (glutamine-hydrolyzing) [Algoriphagus hitonicola]|uniref:asparagine synthase (glutamine-hydrolyzing) n=1 Tax=Algoriphagus hitonicola TaxID=435880 RepID=A0A1I2X3N6_9BACT|nr:asparagine synthase (glutamine-hydrolyzing) [Algoriphagus hitonicola]SFH08130.1 asparagine synthase (glutamine-hydrolysing) [Algoriphagus hitonicola]
MCGIVGYINKDKKAAESQNIRRMTDVMIHRGPDSGDIYLNENLALGHRRLSILDLSAGGNQPFISECNQYVLVFNGEIFNFKEFYPQLEGGGIRFKTSSDTEVLMHLLIREGESVLSKLNGFFAFAFFNKKKGEILIGRDRFGVKPLFIYNDEEKFVFASEPKAIFEYPVKKGINDEVLSELFFYRYVVGENTVFSGIKRLLPGHTLVLDLDGEVKSRRRWFHLGEEAQKHPTINHPNEWYESTFHQSIQYRMISDVAVGTLLSGGLDSSSVLFSQYHQGFKGISSWNIGFSNYEFDEKNQARALSKEYGFDFNTFEFVSSELMDLTKSAIYFSDEPLTHLQDGHLLGLAQKAKEKVTVLLSGEGADEVFGGYVRYKVHDNRLRYNLLKYIKYMPSGLSKNPRIEKLKKYLGVENEDFQLMTNANEIFLKDLESLGIVFSNILPEYRVKTLEEAKKYFPNNRLRQLLYLEQHTHLQTLNDRNDRTSMGASIECRDPFLDPNLVVGACSLPDSAFSTKGKGKKLIFDTIGQKLPEYITNHPKIGLSVPWYKYFIENEEFRTSLEELPDSPLFKIGLFEALDIHKLVSDFKKNPQENYGLVRQLFFYSLWYDVQFKNSLVTA